jgi:hypothetical protein
MNLKSLLEAVHIDLHLSLEKFGFQQTSVAEPPLGKYHIRNVSFKKDNFTIFITFLFDKVANKVSNNVLDKNKQNKKSEKLENSKEQDINLKNKIFINISLMRFNDNKNLENPNEKDVIISDHFYVEDYDYELLEQKINNILNIYNSLCLNK